ncbi:unnamed protein product [Cylindrotheca closterium]|uniref:Aminopeptidase N n=1 Tax=Cylindrotheca closterium TaxID=2856 RepID=A0AAD2FMT1_9STRA|nr:unnamed protein product [Cylindrotheca closterium]
MNTNISVEESTAPVEIFRTDYEPLPHAVTKINMDFNLNDRKTIVTSELTIQPNKLYKGNSKDLPLDGEEKIVKLLSLSMNGKDLKEGDDFTLAPGKLVIKNPPAGAVLKTVVELVPEDNFKLSGLYKTGPMYCTQCEAMGFRRITYYPDRPDNMAIFEKVRLEADKKAYPVLLANGNMIDNGDLDGGRHYATWTDPFPKPSYLFCCVAGDLGKIHDTYTTMSGRKVDLQVFSESHNVHKLDYAMESLKNSMKWDEDRFGLEYDLDLYNIVAVDSFNMGAMENKGLNVFNTAYVLADKDTATDSDFERVEGVIGHEYFHNWTGNRVTCRDWFQLTLKEGLTVFRDQEFSGDMNSKAVKRIEDVRALRGGQFAEDAGPMSHPIRPNSYISMDNFYTATVYNKGAEVIRMYQTLLSVEGFRKGMDLYFERHDGSAVTCDDFLAAMADANGADLSQFSLWYFTNGTPVVTYDAKYENGTFTLLLTQKSKSDKPLHIPISVGLLDKASGEEVVPTKVLNLKEMTQEFKFDGLKGEVVPSILREFSAPIKLISASGKEDEEALAYLAARDTDGFNKWEASQKLFTSLIFQAKDGGMTEKTYGYVKEAFGRTLTNKESKDYSIIAYALIMPTQNTLAELVDVVDPVAIHKARGAVKKRLARDFATELKERYDELTAAMEGAEFKVDSESIGRRRLRNVCLGYLCEIYETPEEQKVASEIAMAHFKNASGMTDKAAALGALASMDGEGATARDEALEIFYNDAAGDFLVLNKWFTIQAMADLPDALDRVKKLKEHPDFTLKNPNRCRSLVRAFTANVAFHDESGAGYAFLREVLEELDTLNPQISSRMAGALISWKKYNEKRGLVMKAELQKLADMKPISADLFEIVSRGLK